MKITFGGSNSNSLIYKTIGFKKIKKSPVSLSVRIWPFQGRGPGSIPGRGKLFCYYSYLFLFLVIWCIVSLLCIFQTKENTVAGRGREKYFFSVLFCCFCSSICKLLLVDYLIENLLTKNKPNEIRRYFRTVVLKNNRKQSKSWDIEPSSAFPQNEHKDIWIYTYK